MLKDKIVLITGGAGSLGKAIVSKIFQDYSDIGRVIIYSRDELKHHRMNWEFPTDDYSIDYVIGDVRDYERLSQICKGVDVIIHTAALKQISTCENNPEECYKTNVVGTQNVIKAANQYDVSQLLFVSTDKAVDPTSVYGNSKQAGEHLVSGADCEQITCANIRLGNLLGSAGSVIPFFNSIKHRGELPITDLEMTRFGGSLEQGAEACFYALENMKGGEIFIPRWKSFRVGDLAQAIAPECNQRIIGARKNEKMHEHFFAKTETNRLLKNDDFFIITKEKISVEEGMVIYNSFLIRQDEVLESKANAYWKVEEMRQFLKVAINEPGNFS